MPRKTPIGDKNRILVFTKSGGDIDTLAFTFDKNTGVTLDGDVLKNNPVLSFDSEIDNESFQAFKELYLTDTELVDVSSTYTDATKDTSKSSPNATQLLVVHTGGTDPDGKNKITMLNATLDVGSQSISPNTANSVNVIFNGIPASTAVDVTAATLNGYLSDVCTIDSNISFAVGYTGKQKHYTAV